MDYSASDLNRRIATRLRELLVARRRWLSRTGRP